MRKKAKLTLVGAGPGDPELLTLKAWKAIQKADIILYDALVSQAILQTIPSEIPKLCVGKRCGKPSFKQEAIHKLIVACAESHQNIVRLKGGDPFVFGRGQEEINFVKSFGIKTEVIPGISSAIGVPGSCRIPVTHRGSSESFWVITANTKNQNISTDLELAAKSSATIIILMGTRKLAELMYNILAYRSGDTPVSLIQNGTQPEEKVILGRLDSILSKAKQEDFGAPGIIVVGDVVAQHPHFKKEILEKVLSF